MSRAAVITVLVLCVSACQNGSVDYASDSGGSAGVAGETFDPVTAATGGEASTVTSSAAPVTGGASAVTTSVIATTGGSVNVSTTAQTGGVAATGGASATGGAVATGGLTATSSATALERQCSAPGIYAGTMTCYQFDLGGSTCVGDVCSACDADTLDCDGLSSNGCETARDLNNCNFCGNACKGAQVCTIYGIGPGNTAPFDRMCK